MGRMTLRRLPEGKFELSGGPLLFDSAEDIAKCILTLVRFPHIKFHQADGADPVFLEKMQILDRYDPDYEKGT